MKTYTVRPLIPEKARHELREHNDHVAQLLFHRGVETTSAAHDFLNPDYELHTHDPFLLADMDRSVDRVLNAIKQNEKLVIYSDYDTDGIPAGVALHDTFKKIGFKNFINYIPHRHDEGFGLNSDAVEQFVKDEVRVLITIDCGIADVVPVALAMKGGIDVIVTDHHLPGEKIPKAFAIINPKREDCVYPEKMLCGAGVIFKFIQALIIKGNKEKVFEIKDGWEKWLLDMIGIATLSDMVPLTGENRVFAYYGLKVLRKSPRVGLVRLLKELKANQLHLVEDDIGFTIGPRINAASRMGQPMDAFRMLATDDEVMALEYVKHLNHINDQRKTAVAQLAKEVKHVMNTRYKDNPRKVIVIGNPEWKPSLLGLAANTSVGEYDCPVFLWGRDGDDVIKGSCRTNGTHLLKLMQHVPEGVFIQFGGHAQSGGFSVNADKVHFLEQYLNEAYEKVATEKEIVPNYVDRVLDINQVSWETFRDIEKLAPFGTGNPKPLYMFKDVTPTEVKLFGKEKNHLELSFAKADGKKVVAIAFFSSPDTWSRPVEKGKPVTLVATFEKSMFRNFPELRLRIVDVV